MDTPAPGARSHFDDEQRPPVFSRRHLLFAGLAVTATVGYASYSSDQPSDSIGSTDAGTSPTTSSRPTTTAAPRPTTTVQPLQLADSTTPPTTQVPTLSRVLGQGMVGDEVEAVQATLAALRFDPGPIDGIFGGVTKQGVWAFEKLVMGTPRTEMQGLVTPDMWTLMNSDVQVTPRRQPGGTHMEVYLPEQVSVLFEEGEARVISHVSSGENVEWCDVVDIDLDDGTTEEKGICGISKTPGGVYQFERKVDGWRNAKLGRLYQPVYFNYGIAIHGAGNVPAYPASRGCVRHPMHIAEYLPDLIDIGDAIYVFDGVEEPEVYGAQPMIFDYPDPNWVPPTTTTSTTTTTTTTTPPTTPPTTTTTTVPHVHEPAQDTSRPAATSTPTSTSTTTTSSIATSSTASYDTL